MNQGKPHRTGTAAVTRSSVLTGNSSIYTIHESNEMRQISPEVLKSTQLASSGGLAVIGGIAGGVVKGALGLVKNVLGRGSNYNKSNYISHWSNKKCMEK